VKWHFTTAELLVMQGRWRDRLRNIYCNKDSYHVAGWEWVAGHM